jgi:hypothetical protein
MATVVAISCLAITTNCYLFRFPKEPEHFVAILIEAVV